MEPQSLIVREDASHYRRLRSMEQLEESEHADTPLGKLFCALVGETVWSTEYNVEVGFGYEAGLCIDHKSFDSQLDITNQNWAEWSVRRVEDAVREHFGKQVEAVYAKIGPLQDQVNSMDNALRRIDKEKARAALAAAYPEAAKLAQFMPEPTDVYCFGERMGAAPTYLVRMVDHEPVGGIARLWDHSTIDWHMLPNGIAKDGRLGYFWAALAKAFVERELRVPETELRCIDVDALEKSWDIPKQSDRYAVDKVVLRTLDDDRRIVVTFGTDNLPAKAEFVSAETTGT